MKNLINKGLITLSLFTLVACAHKGPKITGCIVDAAATGFDCVKYPSTQFFVPFALGTELLCEMPQDLEDQLKACKHKEAIPDVPLCSYNLDDSLFHCFKPNSSDFTLAPDMADNYFCTSPQDRKRLLERCAHMKTPSLWVEVFGVQEN